ncbi:hypothetical protein CSOJ01_11435 [Colletotrichum sojae]|uniref:Uncharacterized protein n=1 Tax=Colletotrichum sojae TaxID=2175907 RepID=A0A8H6IXG0_9PEZI|nr:hypothetical protein CSOJ01_11435 [Colletotrichum sojae]
MPTRYKYYKTLPSTTSRPPTTNQQQQQQQPQQQQAVVKKAEYLVEEAKKKEKKFAPHPPRLQHPEGVPPALPPGGLVVFSAFASLALRPRLARMLELAEPAS